MDERPRDYTGPLLAASMPREAKQNSTMGLSIDTRYINGRWRVAGYEVAEFTNNRGGHYVAPLVTALCVAAALAVTVAALILFAPPISY